MFWWLIMQKKYLLRINVVLSVLLKSIGYAGSAGEGFIPASKDRQNKSLFVFERGHKTRAYQTLLAVVLGILSGCASKKIQAVTPAGNQIVPAPAPAPAFEVASIRRTGQPGPPGDIPENMDRSPGSFAMRNVTLRYALEWAYDLKDYEISGPGWINIEEHYDIIAKAAGPATNEQMRPMLQTLLTERFQMKSHREKKEVPAYVLLPGKGAPKLKPPGEGGPRLSGNAGVTTFHKFPISRLTFLLTRRLNRPVVDMTGLNNLYDFTIDLSGLPPADPSRGPSIFTAVEEDLGLKLEARSVPLDILVIDQVERVPTEN
jgi:uncharacterized protein (TIGR03435 family)